MSRGSIPAWFVVIACAACGAGGAIRNGVYHGTETTYAVGALPRVWERVSVESQDDAAWYRDDSTAVVHMDSSCDSGLDIPLSSLRNHLLIGFTEREVMSEDLVEMDAREALRTHLKAKLDGVPRELLLQSVKKDGCVYDFALVAAPGSDFDGASADFDALLAGFHTVGRE